MNCSKHGAVASNSEISAKTGIDILRKGGSAADAAISTLLVEGLINPQCMGLGGGFLLVIYDRTAEKVECLNSREFAPGNAENTMFEKVDRNNQRGLFVGVPGELMGYWELHKKYGKLPWKELLKPAINYCKFGIPITEFLAAAITNMKKEILKSPSMKEIFINKDTNELYKYGELMQRTKLAETLEKIAEKGPSVLYNGELTAKFIEDIQAEGGIMTKEDMASYSPAWVEAERINLLEELTAFSTPLPSCSFILFFILQVVFGMDKLDDVTKWVYLVETWKFAFGIRCHLDGPTKGALQKCRVSKDLLSTVDHIKRQIEATEMTHQDVNYYCERCFVPYFGGGTGHFCFLAPNGDAISVTSSINAVFGAVFASSSTGIILNNHMLDFTVNPKDSFMRCNKVGPNKQPLSSMVPTIVIDNKTKNVRLIVGCAGATKIITTTSMLIIDHLLYKIPIEETINNKRIHHQLKPMVLKYEEGFPFVDQLKCRGHVVEQFPNRYVLDKYLPMSSAATAISVENGDVKAFGDPRRLGAGLVM